MSNPNYTTNNIDLALIGNGNDTGAWDVPVNANFTAIDNALGGSVIIPVPNGATMVTLTLAQYSNRYISFTGTLSANVIYQLPVGTGTPTHSASVSGVWIINNSTGGSYTLTFASATGSYKVITPGAGQTALIYVSPTGDIEWGDTQYANAQAAAAQAAAITSANNTSANAAHLSSGTVPNAQLPNLGSMPGVTIRSNPGTVPTGSAGDIWFYY